MSEAEVGDRDVATLAADRKKHVASLVTFDARDGRAATQDAFITNLLKVNRTSSISVEPSKLDATFDGMLQLCIETFAMYVYCPDENLTNVVDKLSAPAAFKRLKQTLLQAVREVGTMNNNNLKRNIYRFVFAFVYSATTVAMENVAESHVKVETKPKLDKLDPYESQSKPPEYYDAIYNLCKAERSKIAETVKQVEKDDSPTDSVSSPTHLTDARKINHYNVDDMAAEFTNMAERVKNMKPCDVVLNDYDFLFKVVQPQLCELKPYTNNLETQRYFERTKSSFKEAAQRDEPVIATDVNVAMLCYGLLTLLAHRRLVHANPANCLNHKRVFQSDVSETFVRFYHVHTKDYLETCLSREGTTLRIDTTVHNFESLGTMVAATVMDNYVDVLTAKRIESIEASTRDELKRAIARSLQDYPTIVRNYNIYVANTDQSQYTADFGKLVAAAMKGEIGVADLKNEGRDFVAQDESKKVNLSKLISNINDTLRDVRARVIEKIGRRNQQYFIHRDRVGYHETYSNEIKMFMLTSKTFVDQYVYKNSRITKSVFAVINDFEKLSWKENHMGLDLTVRDGFRILAENHLVVPAKHEKSVYEWFSKSASERAKLFKMFPDLDLAGAYATLDPSAMLFSKAALRAMSSRGTYDDKQSEGVQEVRSPLDDMTIHNDDMFGFYEVSGNVINYMSCGGSDCKTTDKIRYEPVYTKTTERTEDRLEFTNTSYAKLEGIQESFKKTKQSAHFERVFDISHDNEVQNIANSMMMGYSATLQQGITMLSYGGSGVGKTSLFFGRKKIKGQPLPPPGLLEVLFSTIPNAYPFVNEGGTLKVSMIVYEVFEEAKGKGIKYYPLLPKKPLNPPKSSDEADDDPDRFVPRFNNDAILVNDETFTLHESEDVTKPCFVQDNMAVLSGDYSILTNRVVQIDEFMTKKRKDAKRIKRTVNNPQSSRSAIVYKFIFKYRFRTQDFMPEYDNFSPRELRAQAD